MCSSDLNIDLEHLDYYRDLEHIRSVFGAFVERLPFYGVAVLCLDDDNVAQLLPQIRKRIITYGLSEQADLQAVKLSRQNGRYVFTVRSRDRELGEISLNRPGRHLVYNSLAAVAVGLELDIDFGRIARALGSFQGVQRRLQTKGEAGGILVVDDYGHHPTEIRATLWAVREGWPKRRVVTVFQPHRYSRTTALFDQFLTAFRRSDVLILCDIYAASEAPLEGVSSAALAEAIRQHGQKQIHYLPEVLADPARLLPLLEPGDLVLTLGAGSVGRLGEQLLALLQGVGS